MSEVLLALVTGVLVGWVASIASRARYPSRDGDSMSALAESLASLGAAIQITASVIERAEARISALDARLSAEIAEQNRMRHDSLGRLHTLLASMTVTPTARESQPDGDKR